MDRKRLWVPSQSRIKEANITNYQEHVFQRYNVPKNYKALHHWSITQREQFWVSILEFTGIKFSSTPTTILRNGSSMLDSRWFEGVRLNFAENLLRNRTDEIAIISTNENEEFRQITYNRLYQEVSIVIQALKLRGVKQGDRVVGLLPNIIETIICMLATTSIGAIWSSTSPEFGYQGVYDRFFQIEPKILFTTNVYVTSGVCTEQLSKVARLAQEITSITNIVVISYNENNKEINLPSDRFISWENFKEKLEPEQIIFEQLPFDHPVYVMYTSGTTGKPKCIVHGAGGTLLQHVKELILHTDLKKEDKLCFLTSCGWMMWNWTVSSLFVGSTLVLFDGSPFFPNEKIIFRLAEQHKITILGAGAKYFDSLRQLRFSTTQKFNLGSLNTILSTGSPLGVETAQYIYHSIKSDVLVSSISGGTDIISCFALGNPTLEVYAGEIQCWGLGMDCVILDEAGLVIVEQKGELVCRSSFPSQPIFFWDDKGGGKYHSSYFEKYPNIWTHGDYALERENGGIIIFGRSDATLKPNGIRIGTSEIYQQVEFFEQILDAVIIDISEIRQKNNLWLFIKLKNELLLDQNLKDAIKNRILNECGPNHVPHEIFQVEDIPYTLSGKKVEIAVKKIICGEEIMNANTLRNPESLGYFKKFKVR